MSVLLDMMLLAELSVHSSFRRSGHKWMQKVCSPIGRALKACGGLVCMSYRTAQPERRNVT